MSVPSRSGAARVLHGVDHTARPTWKLRETVEFYRDKLGLPLVHVISARGWGPATHPDFLHFFFDSGNGSTIAFFYYLGSEPPPAMDGRPVMPPMPDDHIFDATHTAWLVESEDELKDWKNHLEAQGLQVSVQTTHEVIESIYVRDPNGYFVEFTRKLRALTELDASDAQLTLQAAIQAEADAHAQGRKLLNVDEVWSCKATLLESSLGKGMRPVNNDSVPSLVRIFVPRVAEFSSIVKDAQGRPDCRVSTLDNYDVIEADGPIEFRRKTLGLKPAVWYGLFTGGVRGKIDVLDRDRAVITSSIN